MESSSTPMSTEQEKLDAALRGEQEPEDLEALLPLLKKRFGKLGPKRRLRAIELCANSASGPATEFIKSLLDQKNMGINSRAALLRAAQKLGLEIDQAELNSAERWIIAASGPAGDFPIDDFTGLAEKDMQAVLALLAEVEAADILNRLSKEVSGKAAKKAVKKALHRLRSSGIEVEQTREARHFVMHADSEADQAFVTPFDSAGERLLLLHRASGFNIFFTIGMSDSKGIVRAESYASSVSQFKRMVEEMRKSAAEIPFLEIPADHAKRLIRQAEDLNWSSGLPFPDGYNRDRQSLGLMLDKDALHPLFTDLDPEAVRKKPALVYRSHELLSHLFFTTLAFPPEVIQDCKSRIDGAAGSLIVLTDAQKKERVNETVKEESEKSVELTGPDVWANRLVELAYMLYLDKELEQAEIALATAQALESEGPLPEFFNALMLREFQEPPQTEQEQSSWKKKDSGLILLSDD